MAHRIVSWSDNDICISPVLSSTASIVSFDSTFSGSDTYPSMFPTASEVPELPSAEFGAMHTSLPRSGLSEGRTPRGGHAAPDDSFVRHDVYFFKDGNVTFLVDGTLYCVHRYFFSRDSVYFSTRFAKLDIHDHEALPTIISIGDVKRDDFEALLSILYPTSFEAHKLTYKQWKSVLHLSTRWGFASLRKLALNSIKPPTPHDQLVLARTYLVEHWVVPALTALCSRTLPLSLDEARQMSMEDVILVATVREDIRGGALRVDVADIPRHMANLRAEAKAQQAKLEAETKAMAKADAEAEVTAEADDNAEEAGAQKAKCEVDLKTKAEAREAKFWAKTTAMAREKCEAEEKPTTEAESKEKLEREACARAKAEAEARKKAEAEAWEKWDAKVEADAKVAQEARVKAAEAKAVVAKAELEVKQKVEKERLETEVKSNAEAARAEFRARLAAEEERIARQRAADKAARAAAATSASSPISPAWGSGGGSWFSKIASVPASAIIPPEEPAPPPKSTSPWNSDPWSKRHVKNASSSSAELGPLRGPGGPGAPVQHTSTTSSPPVYTHHATFITARPSSAGVVSSAPTLVSQERKLTNDKQDSTAKPATA